MATIQTRLAHAEHAADRLSVPLNIVDPAPPLDRMERLWWDFIRHTRLPDAAHDAFERETLDDEPAAWHAAYDIVARAARCSGLVPGADLDDVLDWIEGFVEVLNRGGAFVEIPVLPAYTRPGQVNTFATIGLAAYFAAFPLVHRTLLREGEYDRDRAEAWRTDDPVAVLVYRVVFGLEMMSAFDSVVRMEAEATAGA